LLRFRKKSDKQAADWRAQIRKALALVLIRTADEDAANKEVV
jgi:hypothetical protein